MSDTSKYSEAAVALLKANLGHYGAELPPDIDAYLKHLLTYAFSALARAGIDLKIGEIFDDELQAMYAAWLYRKSIDGAAKPAMLQQEIRDRQVANALIEEATE